MLFSIFTYNSIAKHAENLVIKFADDTTVTGRISNNNETPCRDEVTQAVNLTTNVHKTKYYDIFVSIYL